MDFNFDPIKVMVNYNCMSIDHTMFVLVHN